ncbi:MAG: DUF6496 domain-containing protein [Candidatus Saccharimonadales bacterium]
MAKYGKIAVGKIEQSLHEYKHEGKFESRDQAIAAGIAQARKAGSKLPPKPKHN